MKILGICCSPRKGQATYKAMVKCLMAARDIDARITTDLIELAGIRIEPCRACDQCKQTTTCSINDDFQSLMPALADPNVVGLIIGTPVYLGCMTAQCKAFLDRTVVFRRNGWLFRNRVGGVLAVGGVRNGGQELTIQAVQAALLCHDMLCVSDGHPTAHFGATVVNGGEGMEQDTFGLSTVQGLGRRVAELALQLYGQPLQEENVTQAAYL